MLVLKFCCCLKGRVRRRVVDRLLRPRQIPLRDASHPGKRLFPQPEKANRKYRFEAGFDLLHRVHSVSNQRKFRSFIYCPPIQLNNFLRIFSNKSYMLQYVNAVYDPEPPKYDCPPIQLNNDCFYSFPCHSKIVLSK